jgi:hypothetical protein
MIPFYEQFPKSPAQEISRQRTNEKRNHQPSEKNNTGQIGEEFAEIIDPLIGENRLSTFPGKKARL